MCRIGMTCMLLFALAAPQSPGTGSAGVVPSAPRDGDKLPAQAQPIYFSAARATEWLKLTNKPDGRFVYGFQPSLRVPLEGDNFLSQAGATLALARAARYFRDERGSAIARQAALSLLLDTSVDEEAALRFTSLPSAALNRLAGNGLLVSAIHELANPGKDLLDQADQMCHYLRKQQRSDGSLFVSAGSNLIKSGSAEYDAVQAGWALQGIIRSHQHRPADWKLEALRKARPFYVAQWQADKNVAMVCSHTPAYAQAYAVSKDAAFAEAVFVMNDWLLGLQYREEFEPGRRHWTGGFPRVVAGRTEQSAPDIWSALPAVSLAEACRVAQIAGDLPRFERYERALILNVHFLMSLQYTPARTQHFVENFRPSILGAFYASHQDGNLRLDYTQHSLCAMVQYLDTVVRSP